MKFSKNSYWLRSGLFTIFERGSLVLFGFGSFFFLVRMITKEEFGIWSLFIIVTSIIEVARNGLIQNAQIKYMASTPAEEHPKIMTASLTLNVLLTVLSVTFLWGFARTFSAIYESPILETMLYYYILTTISLIFHSQFNFIQQGSFDFKGIFFSNFVRQGSFFVYIAACFLTGWHTDLITLVNFQTVSAVLGAATSYFFVRKYLRLSRSIDWGWVKKLFHYGKFVFGTNISSTLFKSIDQMMLGSIVSTGSVALYNTAVRITNLVEVPTVSVAQIVFPQSAKRMAEEGKDAVRHLYEKSVGVILALVFPMIVVVLLFTKPIILLTAGEKYLDAVPILQITILYSLFFPFARQFGTVLDSIGMPKVNFYFILFSAVLNITVNYLFITNFGIMGAAFGSLTTHSLLFVGNQMILSRILNVKFYNALLHAKDFYIQMYHVGTSMLRQRLAKSKSN